MKWALPLLVLLAVGSSVQAQTYTNAIGSPFRNEAGHVVFRSAAGDTYLGGSVGDSAVVMRLDINGGVIWSRAFRTEGQYPLLVLHLADAGDGTIIGCGSGVMGNQELAEGFYFRFDAAGNFFWVRSWEDPTVTARRILPSEPGFFVVFGGVESTVGPTFRDLHNTLIDAATGDVLATTDRMDMYDVLPYHDELRGVAQIGVRNYAVSSFSTSSAALTGRRIMLTTFDLYGFPVDSRYLIYPDNVDRRVYPTDVVAKDDSLTILYYGDINGSSTNWSVGLIRCDTLGNVAWARDFNLAGSGQEHSTRVLATADGYLLAGRTMTTVPNKLFLMSISESGVGQWYKSYGGAFQEQSLVENYAYNVEDMGNGYLFTGFTNQTGDRDIYLVRTDELGFVACDEVIDRSALTTELPEFNFPATTLLTPFFPTQEADQPEVGDAGVLDSCVVDVALGNDTTLCGPLTLDATQPGATYEWQDGSTDPTFEATVSGSYWVLVSIGCCIGSDTIEVEIGQLADLDLGVDTTLCGAASLLLQAPVGPWTYAWQDGSSDPEFTVDASGTYWVDVTDGPCTVSDTVVVALAQVPTLDLGSDTVSCDGSGVLLVPTVTDVEDYLWSDGSTDPTLQVDVTTLVDLEVSNVCGMASDMVLVTVIEGIDVDLGPDSVLCAGATITLQAPVEPGWSPQWSDGSNATDLVVVATGIYWLDMQQAGCALSDTIVVSAGDVPSIDLGVDTVVCDGGGLLLTPVLVDVDGVLWSTGSTANELSVDVSGSYSIEVSNICGSSVDSIEVTLVDPTIALLGADTVLCADNDLLLDLSGSGATLTWMDGSQGDTFLIDSAGTYYVDALIQGCFVSDTLVVDYDTLQVFSLGPDTVICTSFVLSLETGDANTEWQDGSVGATFDATRTGTYVASIPGYCGTASDTVRISFAIPVVPIPDLVICPGEKVELDPQGQLVETRWTTGDTLPTITVGEGAYGYEATDIYGCEHADYLVVRIRSDEDGIVYIPNSFTPNLDGFNDEFLVMGPERGDFELRIHDRWGEEIFATIDPFDGWDGTTGGEPAPPGVYIYTVEYRDVCNANDTKVDRRGHVTLLR